MQIQLRFFYMMFLIPFLAIGQSKEQGSMMPTSLAPTQPKKAPSSHRMKAVKFHKTKVRHTARYEFYERVEKAAKEKQKVMRKMAKPQYSNPRYFGHKCLPKKRPYWRMRYCKECGIRH